MGDKDKFRIGKVWQAGQLNAVSSGSSCVTNFEVFALKSAHLLESEIAHQNYLNYLGSVIA